MTWRVLRGLRLHEAASAWRIIIFAGVTGLSLCAHYLLVLACFTAAYRNVVQPWYRNTEAVSNFQASKFKRHSQPFTGIDRHSHPMTRGEAHQHGPEKCSCHSTPLLDQMLRQRQR